MRIALLVLVTISFAAGCPNSGTGQPSSAPETGSSPDTAKNAGGGDATPRSKQPAPEPAPADPDLGSQPTTDPYSFHSSAGTYLIHMWPVPEELPTNEMVTLNVAVVDSSTGQPLADEVFLAFDAAMPGHGHGMNTLPKVNPASQSPGRFQITGVNLHMSGDWELYFDVTYKGVTERAQVNVTLE